MEDKELIAKIEDNNNKLMDFVNGSDCDIDAAIKLFDDNSRLCKMANKLGVSVPGKSIMMMASARIAEITCKDAKPIYYDLYGRDVRSVYADKIKNGRGY